MGGFERDVSVFINMLKEDMKGTLEMHEKKHISSEGWKAIVTGWVELIKQFEEYTKLKRKRGGEE